MTSFGEPARHIPEVETSDVLIAGGGPAKIMAGIAQRALCVRKTT
jgi:ribulose 1,5-bisphosphate synthetase/thiazole synthase